MMETDKKPGSWWYSVQRDMGKLGCKQWHTAVRLNISLKSGRGGKRAVANSTKAACQRHWLTSRVNGQPQLHTWPLEQPTTLSLYMSTCVLPVHVYDHRSNRLFLSLGTNNSSVCAPYLCVYMSTCVRRAFCLFRLGIARLHMYEGRQHHTPLLGRTCAFCASKCNRSVVECMCVLNALCTTIYVHVFTDNCTKMDLTPRQ